MPRILFVRHAQSEANVARVWQGRGDAPLSDGGRAQVEALASRINGRAFDVVISSPLARAYGTALAFDPEPVRDERLVEVDLGRWEGMGYREVGEEEADRDTLMALGRGEDVAMGHTGERPSQVARRVWSVVDELTAKLSDDATAAVVTHGGVIDSVIARFFPPHDRRPHGWVTNTALTGVVQRHQDFRLTGFNDAGHLGPVPLEVSAAVTAGYPVIALIRHARTRANVEQRWQGQSSWGLDDVGRKQTELLEGWMGRLETVYSSPLERALATATAIAAANPIVVNDLQELSMGRWEGLTTTEIMAKDPDLFARIYEHGEDAKRGGDGESWAELTLRVRAAIDSLPLEPGSITGVVSHGGAIRAYISSLTSTTDTHSQSLYTPPNTGVTHVAVTPNGPVLLDYALAPHLDGTDQ